MAYWAPEFATVFPNKLRKKSGGQPANPGSMELVVRLSVVDCVRWTDTAWQSTGDEWQTEDVCSCSVSPDVAFCTHCCLLHRGG